MSNSGIIEDFSVLGPADVLALEQNQIFDQQRPDSPVRRGRKRKVLPEEIAQPDLSIPDMRDIHDMPPPTPAPIELKGDLGLDNQFGNDSMMPPPATPNMSHSMLSMPGMQTPSHLGGMTPMHGLDENNPMLSDPALNNLDSIPNLNADTVSSILNDEGLDHFANMGYDAQASPSGGISERIANDWNEDYDFPASVGQVRRD